MLHEIIDPYRTALADHVQFIVAVPSTLPPVYIDRTLVGRSLTNIIENALHAMGSRGTLTLTASADEEVVRVRISDTGAGMDADALQRAFEPYFSTKATGTGLGLTIAKELSGALGGHIDLSSEVGRGSRFELVLPA
jgi:signal transduction histidine kinase